MARGGARPGAGRKKGSTAKLVADMKPAVIRKAARAAGASPLEYMLGVMNDPAADDRRRDAMAQAAAPYVHAKPAAGSQGKKEAAEEASRNAGVGTAWGDDLAGPAFLN